jgi:hypothetical protein
MTYNVTYLQIFNEILRLHLYCVSDLGCLHPHTAEVSQLLYCVRTKTAHFYKVLATPTKPHTTTPQVGGGDDKNFIFTYQCDLCFFLLIYHAKSLHKVNDTKIEWLFPHGSVLRKKRGRQPTLYKTVHIIFTWNKLKWDIRFSSNPKKFQLWVEYNQWSILTQIS